MTNFANTPKVSIVMPAYNCEAFVEDSIRSIIDQTFDDWRLIVINDGSTDKTAEIISRLAASEPRIVFIENESNMGVSYTRNRAISLADGEWIAFLDSDDLWREDKLEKQLALLSTHKDAVISYTASAFITEDGVPYEYVMRAPMIVDYKMLMSKNLLSCSSVIVKTSVMKQIKMPNDKMHEDYYTWLKILSDNRVAYGVDEGLLIYRLRTNSKSSSRIKSAKMLFNTYRAVGYNVLSSAYYVFKYFFYSISKRRKIYSSIANT